ncbi:hypothetical protein GQX73_g6625 [Xylaria multiplex]|uniref:Uncharacterized protein n=1 Tax=Xylaria multiplex TaxID=323545 RepID=A0A7C8IYX1_9PEZI|nr:hypothetical protein GQX73_g6625 [Xylaria multiplex]
MPDPLGSSRVFDLYKPLEEGAVKLRDGPMAIRSFDVLPTRRFASPENLGCATLPILRELDAGNPKIPLPLLLSEAGSLPQNVEGFMSESSRKAMIPPTGCGQLQVGINFASLKRNAYHVRSRSGAPLDRLGDDAVSVVVANGEDAAVIVVGAGAGAGTISRTTASETTTDVCLLLTKDVHVLL